MYRRKLLIKTLVIVKNKRRISAETGLAAIQQQEPVLCSYDLEKIP